MKRSKRSVTRSEHVDTGRRSCVLRQFVNRALVLAAAAHMTVGLPAYGAELPVPCLARGCSGLGGQQLDWIQSGIVSLAASNNTMTITQSSDNAVLNWRSFNISADGTVNFVQPDSSSIALNRIFDTSVSRIQGSLNANGQVYLLNQNGILFGKGAKVNVGGLVASSLNIAEDAMNNGILYPAIQQSPEPAFTRFEQDGVQLPSGAVQVDPGAQITTSAGGQVLMFAPEIVNRGTIKTPEGQTILAAGDSVFLLASKDKNLRGILVEVGVGGTVINGEQENSSRQLAERVGEIVAERGNVTLAGVAVQQLGRVSATTSVRRNGSIRLQARDGGSVDASSLDPTNNTLTAAHGGALTVGEGSVTEVRLDISEGRAIDATEQLRSSISLDGRHVNILSGSRIVAPGGDVTITASEDSQFRNPIAPPHNNVSSEAPSDARIYIASDAVIDVSGAHTPEGEEISMERNSLRVELRGNELRDSPRQRDGALRSQPVYVDIRNTGTRPDGTTWYGTPIADLSGNIATIQRDVFERNSIGGNIRIGSSGDIIVAPSATLDVSGGQVRYADGHVLTSQLLGADGRIYDISTADRDREYLGTVSGFSLRDPRWGIDRSYAGFGSGVVGRAEERYVEGKDAGEVVIAAPRLLLDGNIVGETVAGRYQRLPSEQLAAGTVFRPVDQLPRGARLQLGAEGAFGSEADFLLGDVVFGSGYRLPGLTNPDGSAFDARTDDWIEGTEHELVVRRELFGEDAVSELTLFANGRVTVPEGEGLVLPAGGSVSITALHIDVGGDITVPSGTIDLIARRTVRVAPGKEQVPPSLMVGPNATLAARGAWVNDNVSLNPDGAVDPLHVDGGEISLTVQNGGELTLADGSVVDVSGGAWRTGSGDIRAGTAGSIALTAEANTFEAAMPGQLTLNGELRAFALEEGGALTLETSGFCISLIECEGEAENGALHLSPEFFEQGGFGSFELIANHSGLTIAEGTHIRPRQHNFQITRDTSLLASGTAIEDFTQQTLLSDVFRHSTDLTLAVAFEPGNSGGTELQFNDATFDQVPVLSIAQGASIETDPGASIELASNSSILLGGSLIARGGNVAMTVNTDLVMTDVAAAQGIWLGERSLIDVSGAAHRLVTSDIGRISGEVLAGGTVHLRADRGYVVTQPGSIIDISGSSAALDVQTSPTSFARREVGSDAGLLGITAAEGVILNADLHAEGGLPTHAGGQFNLTLTIAARDNASFGDSDAPKLALPNSARNIILTDETSPIAIALGSRVPDGLNGQATVNVESLEQAGFDDVSLVARNTFAYTFLDGGGVGQGLGERGRITFAPGIDFSVRSRLQLDAAVLDAAGDAKLSSSYVSLANTATANTWDQELPTTLASGDGRLSLFGQMIDVQGAVAVENADILRLESSGDLRLRGVIFEGGERFNGSLLAAGDIELHAAQIYPATMTDFRVATANTTDGEIRTSGGGATTPLLSAAGKLTLDAPTIRHGGNLRSPFGTVELIASNEVILQPGSVVSTRADTTIPFGVVQGGFDWTYTANSTVVFGEDGEPIPAQQVSLQSDVIDFQQGATIDVSGGGELQAYEWIPGVGGSIDVLSALERPNQFAIIPTSQLAFAPYDDALYAGSTLQPGDSIYLSGGGGIKAGTYTLMPARYALLPGAYLVTGIDGYRDIAAGQTFSRIDGSTVVAGYRTMAGTNIVDSRFSGFAISSAAAVRAESQYDLFSATKFFTEQALEADTPVARLANDAGRIALAAGSTLNLDGTLRATAGEKGRGAALDISASQLRIVNSGASAEEGIVNVDATALSLLGAESILLGGRRQSVTEGTSINVTADAVQIAADVSLTAPELLLTARDTVTVSDGATLTARGEAAGDSDQLLLTGDSALLRVSQADQVDIVREGAGRVTGTLDVATTARLSANGGSVTVDSSMDTISLGQLELQGGSLGISASRISLGVTDQPVDGLLLAPDQFSGLGLQELALRSRSSIDFYGNVQLAAEQDLTLDAAALTAASAGTIAQLSGDRVTLTNGSGATIDAAMGDGQIDISANELALDSGALALNGFATARLAGSEQIVAVEDGSIETAGALDLDAARVIGAAGVEYSFGAGGALGIHASSNVSSTAEVAPLGARLAFTGSSIRHEGRIETPSGIVEMTATGVDGDIVVAGGTILAQGRQSQFDGVSAAAPAGSISLTSNAGNVLLEGGSLLDVSAAAGGDAGRVTLSAIAGSVALNGQLAGAANDSLRSGEFIIDAQSVGDLTQMNSVLSQGGFFAQRSVRQRGAGDLVLAAGSDWRVHDFDLTADQGSVRVVSNILGNGSKAGTAILSARDDVVISGDIDLSASGAGQRGGRLEVRSSEGGVFLEGTAAINVAAGAILGDEAPRGGTVHARLTRDAVNTLLNDSGDDDALRFASTITGAESVTIEGYQVYDETSGVFNPTTGQLNSNNFAATTSNVLYGNAADFMSNAATLIERLGFAPDSVYRIVPGIEIRSSSALMLGLNTSAGTTTGPAASSWNLAGWRFGPDAVPGVLTLRSAGDLTFNRSLSDGFVAANGAGLYTLLREGNESWSYRLVAGADIGSSDVLAVQPFSATDETGDLTINAGTGTAAATALRQTVVRTGTGNIEVATRRNFDLTGQRAVLYTAGVAGTRGNLNDNPRAQGGFEGGTGYPSTLAYPINGGDISIYSQGDITGARSNQLVTSWLWRAGGEKGVAGNVPESSVAWTVSHRDFEQNVGALGGGNIQIEAGQNITNFSASIPSIGRQVGGDALADSVVEVIGGGSLNIRAGGDIAGGTYFTGLGDTLLASGGSIGPTRGADGAIAGLAPIFAVGDGQVIASARQDTIIETVLNPTLIGHGRPQLTTLFASSYFSTYDDSSAAQFVSAGGDVALGTGDTDLTNAFSDLIGNAFQSDKPNLALRVYPSRLRATSFSGDVEVNSSITLYPSSLGNLELFAERDLVISPVSITLPDSDPELALPTIFNPLRSSFGQIEAALQQNAHGAVPLYSRQRDEVNTDPVRLVARTGDVTMTSDGATALFFPKPSRIVAGQDILGLAFSGQNILDTDVTSLIAGRDIRYIVGRGGSGQLLPIRSGIELAGPGYLEVRAGRNIDLQTSAGITTVGSQNNPALPDRGASISVLAGVNGSNQNNGDFLTRYLQLGEGFETNLVKYIEAITGETDLTEEEAQTRFDQLAAYRSELVEYVEKRSGQQGLTESEALAIFRTYSASEQQPLIGSIFFSELRSSGQLAADPKHPRFEDYRRAYSAIGTLYPGANPNLDAGEKNPYSGDINLYFSRIFTLNDGDISLFAPGGEINAGLATPPSAFGIEKGPDQLGIVARQLGNVNSFSYGDFNVNESRVFSADGDDILVWSTRGDIDAGRGSKTAVSAPTPTLSVDVQQGTVETIFRPALAGSGIRAIVTTKGRELGNVDLYAPRGVINAGDAGIACNNCTFGATAVLGADNIDVGGIAIGVPVDTGGLGASLASVSAAASSAASAATAAVDTGASEEQQSAPLADTALSWLEVFVVGLGEDTSQQEKRN